jgi:hypothetical protein
MKIRIQEHGNLPKFNKNTLFPVFQKGVCTFEGMFIDILSTGTVFLMNKASFVTLKSGQDTDPHGSALAWANWEVYMCEIVSPILVKF